MPEWGKLAQTIPVFRCAVVAATVLVTPSSGWGAACFEGRVISEGSGTSIAGAKIVLDPVSTGDVVSARTDLFGFFKMYDLPVGSYTVTASHVAHAPLSGTLAVDAEDFLTAQYQLTPLGTSSFSLFVDVRCAHTDATLVGAKVTLRRWSQPDFGVPPDEILVQTLDQRALIAFENLAPGFIRTEVVRPGWHGSSIYVVPSGDPEFVATDQEIFVALGPDLTDLEVSVKGHNPYLDRNGDTLAGVLVEVTGLDFLEGSMLQALNQSTNPAASTAYEVLPSESGLTPYAVGGSPTNGLGGSITFKNLPPIRYRVVAKRHGYLEENGPPFHKELIVAPRADGTFAPVVLDPVRMADTRIEIELKSMYADLNLLAGATVRIVGIEGTNAEYIEREVEAMVVSTNGSDKVVATFENILPGTYGVHIRQDEQELPATAVDALPPFGPPTGNVRFFPIQSYVEVALSETAHRAYELVPVPAVVRGLLQSTDVLTDPWFPSSHDFRVFTPAQALVEFHAKAAMGVFKEPLAPVHAVSGEDGRFTISVPPGFYGIKIPDMTSYTGHDITLKDFNQPGAFHLEQGWPYPDVFPHGAYEYGHHWSFVELGSGDDVELSMQVHGHFTHLLHRVAIDEATVDPVRTGVLYRSPDGSHIVTTPFDDLGHSGQVRLTGPGGFDIQMPVDASRLFLMQDLQPGNYTLNGLHDRYGFNTVNFTVDGWDFPGALPPLPPSDITSGFFFPGITHNVAASWYPYADAFKLTATYPAQLPYTVTAHRWDGVNQEYDPVSVSLHKVFIRPNWSPMYFKGYSWLEPAGGNYEIWYDTGEGWYAGVGDGSGTLFEIFIGGLNDNVIAPGLIPPFVNASSEVQVRAVQAGDAEREITGIQVTLMPPPGGGTGTVISTTGVSTHPGMGSTRGQITVQSVTDPDGKWLYTGFVSSRLLNLPDYIQGTAPRFEVEVRMQRGMIVRGKVTGTPYSDDGSTSPEGIVDARVEILERKTGRVLNYGAAFGVSASNGTFEVTGLERQAVFVEIKKAGYLPFRKRFDLPGGQEDLLIPDGTLHLTAVPPPKMGTGLVQLDRFGLFVPGVLKSGDASGFNVNNARRNLTLTWRGGVNQADDYSYTLDAFDPVSGGLGGQETHTVCDPVREAVLIDQRWFVEPFKNDPDANESPLSIPSATPTRDEADRWLMGLRENHFEGGPFFVVSDAGDQTTESVPGFPTRDAVFSGTLKIEELPPGTFDPMVMFVSERGGVRVVPYRLPEGRKPLRGVLLPRWATGMMEFMGMASTLNPYQGLETHDPRGNNPNGRLAWSGSVDSGIELTRGGYLTYEYGLSGSWQDGGKSPSSGPLAAMSGVAGLSLGAKGSFKVAGEAEELALSLSGKLGVSASKEDLKRYAPAILGGVFTVKSFTLSGSVKGSFVTRYGEIDKPTRTVPDQVIRVKTSGFVQTELSRDITDTIAAIPPAKVIAFTLSKVGVISFYATVPIGVGGGIERDITTISPRPRELGSSSATGDFEPYGDALGGADDPASGLTGTVWKTDLQILAGAKLDVSALGDKVTGYAGLQLGPPKDLVGQKGLKLTFNSIGEWPPVKSILGAGSFIYGISANIGPFNVGRSFQHDLKRIEWYAVKDAPPPEGSGAEWYLEAVSADSRHEVYDLHSAEVTLLPSGMPPSQVTNDASGTVVRGLFNRYQYAVADGDASTVLFSTVHPGNGLMELAAATQDPGGDWGVDSTIASAPYLHGMALLPDPAGGDLAVWIEIEAGDMGNAFPPSRVMYATRDEGESAWDTPQVLASLPCLGETPRLAPLGDRVMLSLSEHLGGPASLFNELHYAVWDGRSNAWTTALTGLEGGPAETVAFDLVGTSSTNPSPQEAVIVQLGLTGDLEGFAWSNQAWTSTAPAAMGANRHVAVTRNPTGQAVAAFHNILHGGIELTKLRDDLTWTTLTSNAIPTSALLAVDLHAYPAGDATEYLVVWAEGAQETRLYYAVVDDLGGLVKEPTVASFTYPGTLRSLRVVPTGTNGEVRVFSTCDARGVFSVKETVISRETEIVEGPVVTLQPISSTNAPGAEAVFSVEADGVGRVTYQWLKDHVAVPGATGATHTVGFATSSDQGLYTVLLTDDTGLSISDSAELVLVPGPMPSPVLTINRLPGGDLELSWPDMAGFVLQRTSALTAPAEWWTVPGVPVLTSGLRRVHLPSPGDTSVFFRLALADGGDIQPVLAVEVRAGPSIHVSWGEEFTGFTLQESSEPGSTSVWVNTTQAPVIANGRHAVHVGGTPERRVFRLAK